MSKALMKKYTEFVDNVLEIAEAKGELGFCLFINTMPPYSLVFAEIEDFSIAKPSIYLKRDGNKWQIKHGSLRRSCKGDDIRKGVSCVVKEEIIRKNHKGWSHATFQCTV